MEAGLKHYLPMGYNEDPRTRRIFVHVFAHVLQQGTSLVAVNSLDDSDRYSRLCEVSGLVRRSRLQFLTFFSQMVRAPDVSELQHSLIVIGTNLEKRCFLLWQFAKYVPKAMWTI